MKLTTKALLLGLTGAGLATSAMAGTQAYDSQYMHRKLGRYPPKVEKAVEAEHASQAFRAVPAATNHKTYDQRYMERKWGRKQ